MTDTLPTVGGAGITIGSGGLIRFSMQLVGADQLLVSLSRFGEKIVDWRPFWRGAFADFFYDWTQTVFATEGAVAGGWAPLSPSYAAWKAKHFGKMPILQRTRLLAGSLASPTAAGAIFRDSPTGLVIGTAIPYGIYHQTGGHRLPQRRFLVFPYRLSETVGRMLHRFAVDTLNASAGTGASSPGGVGLL